MMLSAAALALTLLVVPTARRKPPPPPPPSAAPKVPEKGAEKPADPAAPPAEAAPVLPRRGNLTIPVVPGSAPRTQSGWRVENVGVLVAGTRRFETRVLRSNGTPVTVAQGLGAVGLEARLQDRARAKVGMLGAITAGGVGVLVAGGMMAVGGVLAAVVGAVLTPIPLLNIRELRNNAVASGVLREGPFLLFAGFTGLAVGLGTVVVGLVPLVFAFVRPPPVDQDVLAQLGSSLAWDPSEAQEVVTRYNSTNR